jgi:hypothetical protein
MVWLRSIAIERYYVLMEINGSTLEMDNDFYKFGRKQNNKIITHILNCMS